MKHVIVAIALIMGVTVSAHAQTAPKKEKAKKETVKMKEHVCTSACKDGSHVYAHGEKGHTCGEECKKKM